MRWVARLVARLFPVDYTTTEERQLRFRTYPRYRQTQPGKPQVLRLQRSPRLKRVS